MHKSRTKMNERQKDDDNTCAIQLPTVCREEPPAIGLNSFQSAYRNLGKHRLMANNSSMASLIPTRESARKHALRSLISSKSMASAMGRGPSIYRFEDTRWCSTSSKSSGLSGTFYLQCVLFSYTLIQLKRSTSGTCNASL